MPTSNPSIVEIIRDWQLYEVVRRRSPIDERIKTNAAATLGLLQALSECFGIGFGSNGHQFGTTRRARLAHRAGVGRCADRKGPHHAGHDALCHRCALCHQWPGGFLSRHADPLHRLEGGHPASEPIIRSLASTRCRLASVSPNGRLARPIDQ